MSHGNVPDLAQLPVTDGLRRIAALGQPVHQAVGQFADAITVPCFHGFQQLSQRGVGVHQKSSPSSAITCGQYVMPPSLKASGSTV